MRLCLLRASLAKTMRDIVRFEGQILFDTSKPNGTQRKPLNMDRLRALGWQAKTLLRDGITRAFADFLTKVIA